MRISFLGACREVGRSAVLVESKDYKTLLDAGFKVHDHNELPRSVPSISIDAILVTHAHLDHSGAAPTLYKRSTPITFCTPPTIPLATLLLEDAEHVAIKRGIQRVFTRRDIARMTHNTFAAVYGQQYELTAGLSFTYFDAGHIPGSALALLTEHRGGKEKTLLYTGDYKLAATRLQRGAALPQRCDALIIESTYGLKEQPTRKEAEEALCEGVRACIEAGEPALVPSFAVGRAQEIIQMLHSKLPGVDIYVDGMAREASQIIQNFPNHVRDYDELATALRAAHFVEHPSQRKALARRGVVIVSSAGMLDGGPALGYLLEMARRRRGKVFLVGYQVEGTNGRELLERGRIHLRRERVERIERRRGKPMHTRGQVREQVREMRMPLEVEYISFSAHASRSELLQTIARLNPQRIFCIHGDAEACEKFAAHLREQGFDAVAPRVGEHADI